jgi:hypothetical protein
MLCYEVLHGPRNLTTTQPPERIPMWHKGGGLLVTAPLPPAGSPLRVTEQRWDTLVVEAFPASTQAVERRVLYGQEHASDADTATALVLSTDGRGAVALAVDVNGAAAARAWVVRLHLRPGERVVDASADGTPLRTTHLAPRSCGDESFPLGGEGALPPCRAGPVAELRLDTSAASRRLDVRVESGSPGRV